MPRGYKKIIRRQVHNLEVDLDEMRRQKITLEEFFSRVPNDMIHTDWRV